MEEPRDAVDTTSTMYDPLDKVTLHYSHLDSDVNTFLHDANLAFTSRLAPTVAYTVLLSVLGLVGNTVVFLVYYRRFKPTVTRTYILAMSVCDLLSNVLFLPTDVMEIRFHATFYAVWACKLSRSVRCFLAFFCAAVLVAVALDRQRTVCSRSLRSPTPNAFSRVRVSLALCGLVSLAVTVPYSILSGGQTVRFAGSNVTGMKCSIQDRYIPSLFALVYNVLVGVGFVVCVVIIGVSYGKTARFLWLYKKDKRLRRESVGFRAVNVQLKSMKSIPVGSPPYTDLITRGDAASFDNEDSSTYFSANSGDLWTSDNVAAPSPASDPEANDTTDCTKVASNHSSAKSDEEKHVSKMAIPVEMLGFQEIVSSEAKDSLRNCASASTYSSSDPDGKKGSPTDGPKRIDIPDITAVISSDLSSKPYEGSSSTVSFSPTTPSVAIDFSSESPAKQSQDAGTNSNIEATPSQAQVTVKDLSICSASNPSTAEDSKVACSQALITQTSDLTAPSSSDPTTTEGSNKNNKVTSSQAVVAQATDRSDHSPAKPSKNPPASDVLDQYLAKFSKVKGLSSNKNVIPAPESIPPANDLSGLSTSKPTKVESPSSNEEVTSPPATPCGLEEPSSDQNVAPSPEVNDLPAHPSKPNKVKGPSSNPAKKISARTTLMLFVLTALYVVNYLPYIVMVILDSMDKAPLDLDINVSHICSRSYFLNSVVNPFVYSFFNAAFRRECRAFFCPRR
ncbi:uncharacterized protein [Littorina saxatilis]|uniref:G-protein coupled receptors family 1 profile domain-containing protein n=1 Tax=Littorina saxatilis TaxID=31220 RepID=A0AAN9BCC0_9CAEN